MSPSRLLNAFHRAAACAATMTAIALLHASPAQAGSVYSTSCSHGSGYGHSYDRSYNGNWGGGHYGANSYGGGSGSGYGYGGCVSIEHELTNPYVIEVPQPRTEREIAEAAERERLWQARCRPVIRQDHYGVRRYHYAVPDCEYGKYE
jgi:hypothetical protein